MRALLVACALGMAGCAAVEPRATVERPAGAAAEGLPRQFELFGRIAVREGERGFSGNLRWQHQPERDELLLLTPLGQGVAHILRQPGEARLTAGEARHTAPDAETLTEQLLGWRLPLSGPAWWADDIADQAIEWICNQKAVAPDKPFFLYYAPGATHSPHHPKKEWVARYKGKFDQGWDKVREETLTRQKKLGLVPAATRLTERSRGIPAWDSLNAEQKQLYANMMEVYAGFLSQTDYNAGRVLDAIRQLDQMENTLVIYICGDNGASGEGTIQGSYNEMAFMNMIPEDYKEVMKRWRRPLPPGFPPSRRKARPWRPAPPALIL